jgi:hypothetical protein
MEEMPKQPEPFLEVRVRTTNLTPNLLAVCAGYELKEWRREQLVAHLINWLPEFALNHSDYDAIGGHNAGQKMIEAAKALYTSEKYQKRGECGELLLHTIVRQVFGSYPAISKYFFKDSRNDTVKGFDAVHVVADASKLELWLGEVKFYEDITAAISAVVAELADHFERDYLRAEFLAITNKIDPAWPLADRLKKLIHPQTSLDEIFDAVVVPVLLTYDSEVINSHTKVTAAFKQAFEKEVLAHRDTFGSKKLPDSVRIELFLFPLDSKAKLVKAFDERLKKWQALD